MSLLSKLTLQKRVTILTATILVVCVFSLTLFTIYNAEKNYDPLITGVESTYVGDFYTSPQVGVRVVPAQQAKRTFATWSYTVLIVLTILGTGAVYVVTGHALKPVRELSHAVSEIREHNLSNRLQTTYTKDEIGELTDGFNRMLERLNDAFERQRRFTANSAHELKTPLSIIKSGIQVLNMESEPSIGEYKENIEIIDQSIERLIDVVDDLLTIASEGEGYLKKEAMKEVLLGPMFDEILNDVSSLYYEDNIIFHNMCGDTQLMGNPTLLYRAFFNIVENAFKYNTPNGEINISINESNENIEIIILDTGVGIPKDELPIIFEPFYRVDKSRSRKVGGSGLGLSITKTILDKSGASISVESTVGAGTRFVVTFPKNI